MVKPVRGRVELAGVAALADARTRVLSVSFVDWSSGARTQLAPLGEWCRSRGILYCVDGIQGVGALLLDVEQAQVDCLAVGGHKWLLAPEGCGCLFVSRRVGNRLQSVLHGWKSVSDAATYLPYHFAPREDAARFEPGSPSVLGTVALGAAIDLLLEVGPAQIEERLQQLTDRLTAGLRARGAEIISPWEPGARSGMVVFRLGDDSRQLCRALQERRFIVRQRGGGIRVAPHFYTSEDDIDRLLAGIDTLS
jgi:cysteine desulfurase/selenocysteine lyase